MTANFISTGPYSLADETARTSIDPPVNALNPRRALPGFPGANQLSLKPKSATALVSRLFSDCETGCSLFFVVIVHHQTGMDNSRDPAERGQQQAKEEA